MTEKEIRKAIQRVLNENGVRSSYPERLKAELINIIIVAQTMLKETDNNDNTYTIDRRDLLDGGDY